MKLFNEFAKTILEQLKKTDVLAVELNKSSNNIIIEDSNQEQYLYLNGKMILVVSYDELLDNGTIKIRIRREKDEYSELKKLIVLTLQNGLHEPIVNAANISFKDISGGEVFLNVEY